MSVHVATVGIDLPDDFPIVPYNTIHSHVHADKRHQDQVFHFGGSWNGIAYRFLSCANSDNRFVGLISPVVEPSLINRFEQEEALLSFFVNGLAVIESFFYGLYWMGSMVDSSQFPILAGKKLRSINTENTLTLFSESPYANCFANAFASLQVGGQNTPQYDELKDIRNILAHRASCGRVIHLASPGRPQHNAVWRIRNLAMNDQLTQTKRAWLTDTLAILLQGAKAFALSALSCSINTALD